MSARNSCVWDGSSTDEWLKLNFDATTKLADGDAHSLATSVDEIKLH